MYPATESYHFTKEQILDEEYEIKAAMKNISLFSVLYDRYYLRLYRYIICRIDSNDDAADITSQVFLKAMLCLKKYQFRGLPFASWLYRIASNEIVSMYRSKKLTRVFNASSETLAQIAEEVEQVVNEEKMQVIQQALRTLSLEEMELIEMRYFEERSFSTISEITGITENNLKVKIHRIIQKLKEKILKKKKA